MREPSRPPSEEGDLGHDWEIEAEIKIWIDRFKDIDPDLAPDIARFVTIGRWMCNGDLQPLAAAIREGQVDGAILNLLADLIDDGRLSVKKRGRGAFRQPAKFARDRVAFALYHKAKKSEDEIADILGMSEASVHQAIIAVRKARRTVK